MVCLASQPSKSDSQDCKHALLQTFLTCDFTAGFNAAKSLQAMKPRELVLGDHLHHTSYHPPYHHQPSPLRHHGLGFTVRHATCPIKGQSTQSEALPVWPVARHLASSSPQAFAKKVLSMNGGDPHINGNSTL